MACRTMSQPLIALRRAIVSKPSATRASRLKRLERAKLDTARTTGRTVASDRKWRHSTTRLPMKPFAPMMPITGTASPMGFAQRAALFYIVEPRHRHWRTMLVAMLDESNAFENIRTGDDRRGVAANESDDTAHLFEEALMEIGGCSVCHRHLALRGNVAQARRRCVAGIGKADVDGVRLVSDPAQPRVGTVKDVTIGPIPITAQTDLAGKVRIVEFDAAVRLDAAHGIVLVTNRNRRTKPPGEQIENMRPQIEQDATRPALPLEIGAGVNRPPERSAFEAVEPAQCAQHAAFEYRLDRPRGRKASTHMPNSEKVPCFGGRLDHPPRIARRRGQRLLAQHRFAGLKRADRLVRMMDRGGGDDDELDIQTEELFIVVCALRARKSGPDLLCALAVRIEQACHLHPMLPFED